MVLIRVYSAITKDKQIPRSMFMGIPSTEMTYIRHSFDVNGAITVSNEFGDSFTINPPNFGFTPTIELYEDADAGIVAYHLPFNYKGKSYEVWVYFKFNVDPYKVKITITGILPVKGQIKLPFSSSKKRVLVGKCLWHGTFIPEMPDFPMTGVGFDWSDVTSGVTCDDINNQIIFDVGQTFTVDPSIVGTSTTSYATRLPFQRKTFYANGRFWVFYSDGTNMVYATSTDGSTWTTATTIRVCTSGSYFSVWFDGTYLHYAYAYASPIYYRRGLPNADGTITWSAAEQTVSTTYNQAFFPTVSVDSNGYVWIGYRDYDGSNNIPYVIRSGNNDGTWGTTPSGFPYRLSTSQADYVSIIPLTSGKMLAVYTVGSGTVKAKRWTGSAWDTEVATTSAIRYGYEHSAVAQGDDVHLVFLKNTGYDILYVKYTYSSNSFGTETTLVSGATAYSAPVISINTTTNDLFVFAATKTTGTPSGWTANHIYYIKYTALSGTWGSWTDWTNEENEVLTSADALTCFYQAGANGVGLVYMTGTASPYNVKFAFLSLAGVAYTITLTESLGLKDSTVKASSVVKRELLGLSDVYGRTWTAYRTYIEPLGLSDVAVKNLSVAKAESLGLSDVVSSVRLYVKTLTELLGLSDATTKAPSVVKVENLGLLDYYSRLWSVHRTYSENLGLVDYVQKSPSAVKFELLGLSDVVQKSSSILKLELLGLSDFYSRTWTAYRTYTESLGLSDKVSKTAAVPLAETLGLFDKLTKSSFTTKTERLGLTDFTVKGVSVARTERLGLSDVLRKAPGKMFSEPLGLKDVFTRTWSAQKVFTETLGLKDTVSKGAALHALVEVLGLYDSILYAPNVTVLAKLIKKYMQLVNLGGDWNE